VDRAARAWAAGQARVRPELVRLGYFGSYARGDWGVGSDLDMIAIVRSATEPFARRANGWPTEELPVPVDLLVYTEEEWDRLRREGGRFARTVESEVVWLEKGP
jgi:predicted nucleotidyltransferase